MDSKLSDTLPWLQRIAMRNILITLGILVALVVAILASWIFAGRQISLFLDRFGTIEVTSARINSIVYEGNGTGGILHVNDLELGLTTGTVQSEHRHNEK